MNRHARQLFYFGWGNLAPVFNPLAQAVAILTKYGGSLWVADPAYTFTSSAGTGAASDGSDAGYVRDLCATLGPELVSNGNFTSNISGWSVGTGLSAAWSSGAASVSRAGAIMASAAFGQSIPVVAGKTYVVSYSNAGADSTVYYLGADSAIVTNGVGSFSRVIQATASTLSLNFWPKDDGTSILLDNISVREIIGRPLFQSTTSFKPKLKRVPKKLGPELVTNGDFSAGAAGWAVEGTGAVLSVASGVATVTNGGSAEASLTSPNTVAGKVYEVVADIVALSGTSTVYFVPPEGSSTGNIPKTGAGQLRGVFVSGGGGCRIAVGVSAAGAFFSIDNISVREVLEWAWAWVFDGVDDWLGITGAPASPATAHTMGAVAYASTVASRCSLLAMRNTGNSTPLDALEINTGQPTWRQRNDATTTAALSGDVFPVSTRLVVSMRSDGANAVLRQNGVQKSTSATTTGAITVNNLSIGIGRGANVVDPLSGGIFAAFYAPAAIPDAELLIIERAIGAMAGVKI